MTFVLAMAVSVIASVAAVIAFLVTFAWLVEDRAAPWGSYLRSVSIGVLQVLAVVVVLVAAYSLIDWLWSIVPEQEFPW